MRIEIADYCIRCGICEDVYPDMFKRNYETHSMDILIDEIPEEQMDRVQEAIADCAVAAIKMENVQMMKGAPLSREEIEMIDRIVLG